MRRKTKHQRRIEEFMIRGDQVAQVAQEVGLPHDLIRRFRAGLILEEALELVRALGFFVEVRRVGDKTPAELTYVGGADLIGIADGCADLSVVTIGTLSACGIADDGLLKEVDLNNMSKVAEGVHHDPQTGKILKPPGWRPPDIERVLRDQGWKGKP